MRQFPPLTYPPLLPFSYFPFPLEVGPLPRLRLNWSGGALKLPRRAWVKPDRLTQFGLSKTRLGTTSLVLLYKSLFAENSAATQKQYSTSVNTNKNTKYNDQVHHIIILRQI